MIQFSIPSSLHSIAITCKNDVEIGSTYSMTTTNMVNATWQCGTCRFYNFSSTNYTANVLMVQKPHGPSMAFSVCGMNILLWNPQKLAIHCNCETAKIWRNKEAWQHSVKNDVYFVTKGYNREANNRDQYPFLCCIEATIEPK